MTKVEPGTRVVAEDSTEMVTGGASDPNPSKLGCAGDWVVIARRRRAARIDWMRLSIDLELRGRGSVMRGSYQHWGVVMGGRDGQRWEWVICSTGLPALDEIAV